MKQNIYIRVVTRNLTLTIVCESFNMLTTPSRTKKKNTIDNMSLKKSSVDNLYPFLFDFIFLKTNRILFYIKIEFI
jgi:hypothetical protein